MGLVLVHYPSEQPVGGAFVRLYPKDKAGYGFVSEKYLNSILPFSPTIVAKARVPDYSPLSWMS